MTDKIYGGNLVHVSVKDLIPPDLDTRGTTLSAADLLEIAKGRLTDQLAKFLARHFTTDKTQADGSVLVEARITLMLAKVPEGLAHTKIIFKEVP